MKPSKLWERAWKLRGYDELDSDRNIVKLVSFLKRKKFKRILDLGCGIGRHIVYLGKQGFFGNLQQAIGDKVLVCGFAVRFMGKRNGKQGFGYGYFNNMRKRKGNTCNPFSSVE